MGLGGAVLLRKAVLFVIRRRLFTVIGQLATWLIHDKVHILEGDLVVITLRRVQLHVVCMCSPWKCTRCVMCDQRLVIVQRVKRISKMCLQSTQRLTDMRLVTGQGVQSDQQTVRELLPLQTATFAQLFVAYGHLLHSVLTLQKSLMNSLTHHLGIVENVFTLGDDLLKFLLHILLLVSVLLLDLGQCTSCLVVLGLLVGEHIIQLSEASFEREEFGVPIVVFLLKGRTQLLECWHAHTLQIHREQLVATLGTVLV
mmetsp:Transcript_23505/g.58844  ORF Transcript_23505/g.58844 Transcript_23505/m.58844 type:complete len:256 (+) Transcript_23505:268-1035(+)